MSGVGPIGIGLAGAFLVLAVRRCRAAQGRCHVLDREVRRGRGVDASRQPGRHLLQQPRVAVRVAEPGARGVAATLRIESRKRAVRSEVEELAHLDAGGQQRVAGRFDVADDQVGRGGAERGGREAGAELHRAPGAVRCELDNDGRRDVEPPPDAAVELLGAVDIRNGDDDHLDLHVDLLDAGDLRVGATGLGRCHRGLPKGCVRTRRSRVDRRLEPGTYPGRHTPGPH